MSFPRYSKYANGSMHFPGEVPEHWEVISLKRVASLKGRLGWQGLRADEYTDDGPFLVTSEHFANDKIDWHRCYHVSLERFGIALEIQLRAHDLLMMKDGAAMGKLAYVDWLPAPACLNSHLLLFRPLDGRFENRFLYYVLGSPSFKTYMSRESKGSTFFGISQESIGAFRFSMPPLSEQQEIIEFLDRETAKLDQLVAEQRRLMGLLREKRQAIVCSAVTKGLNLDAPMKPSGTEWLGDVPKHWELSRIANVFREVAEAGVDDLPILSVSIHHGVSDKELEDEDVDRKVTRSDDRSKYKRVAPGDLVYNMMRAWQGGFGTVTVAGMVSPAYVVARPQIPIETTYIEYLLRTPQAVEQMRRHSRGVTDFRLRLYWDEFKDLRVALPPREEMKEICAKIAQMDERFDALSACCEESIEVLQERRAALISAAVTGQIDVRRDTAGSVTTLKPYTRGFARQLLAAEILSHCHHHHTTGRVKLQKLIHLCEHVAEIEEVEADYFRKAAGPFDNRLMFGIAAGLTRQRWFSEVKEGRRTFYKPLEKAGEHARYLARWDSKMPKVRKVLDLLGKADTQQCEIVSTLYAAWNDLLIEKRRPSDVEIIREASDPERWHASKLNIQADKWPIALSWMKEKGLIPSGFGTHTKRELVPKESA